MSVAGVVLAAGQSQRFGTNKLLHPLASQPIICHVIANCVGSRLSPIHVVVARHAGVESAIRARFANETRLQFVRTDDSSAGQNASLKAGLRALSDKCTAALLMLGDMPFLPSTVIDRLLDSYAEDPRVTIPICAGLDRHPRLIPRPMFARFLELADDAKPRLALDSLPPVAIRRLEFHDELCFRDVDSPADLPGTA